MRLWIQYIFCPGILSHRSLKLGGAFARADAIPSPQVVLQFFGHRHARSIDLDIIHRCAWKMH